MLQAIRDKAHGIFAWVMLLFVGIPFGLWGINNYFDGGTEKPVVVVGDRDLYERDVNRAYENLVARMGSSDFDEAQLRHEALEQVINLELISQTARNEGLVASEAEVRNFIQSQPYFQTDGQFDKAKMQSFLASQGQSQQYYIAQASGQLVNDQFVRGITDTAFVTKRQLESFYRFRNQERTVDYFIVPLKPATAEIADQAVEAYYQANKSQFENPQKVSVQFISLGIDDVSKGFKPTEEELKALYEEQKPQLGAPEQRRVSHILVEADFDKEDQAKAALAKAEAFKTRLDQGEDFAKLAKENSDDKDSGVNGGDLGTIKKEGMDPKFTDAAFALGKGQVSQPVKTSFGYHLIKLTDIVPATTKQFEEVRAELEKTYKRNAAENQFYDAKQKMDELSFEHNDSLEPLAKALNLTIAETAWFTKDVGTGEATEVLFRNAAFSPEVLGGKNSPVVEVGTDKVYVLHLKQLEPASDKPLAEVKPQIVEILRAKASRDAAKQQAEQLMADIKQGKPLNEAAKSISASAQKTTIKLAGKQDAPPALMGAVNKAPRPADGKPVVMTAPLDNGEQAVFSLTEVKDGALQSVDPKELEMAKDYMIRNNGQAQFNAFLGYLRDKVGVKISAVAKD